MRRWTHFGNSEHFRAFHMMIFYQIHDVNKPDTAVDDTMNPNKTSQWLIRSSYEWLATLLYYEHVGLKTRCIQVLKQCITRQDCLKRPCTVDFDTTMVSIVLHNFRYAKTRPTVVVLSCTWATLLIYELDLLAATSQYYHRFSQSGASYISRVLTRWRICLGHCRNHFRKHDFVALVHWRHTVTHELA